MNGPSVGIVDPSLASLIIESAQDFAIITFDRSGSITSWNPGAERLLGWPASEAVGMDARAIFTQEDRESGVPENEISRSIEDGRALDERWHVRRDGSRFWASGLVMPLREQGATEPPSFVKMMRDRTAERDVERRYHAMTAALPGFVFVADTDGNVVETSVPFQQFTGFAARDLAGARWLDAIHPDDRENATQLWSSAIASGESYEGRHRFRRHDGEYRSFACRAVPEHGEDDQIVRWLGTCFDVESDARARAALERLTVSLEHSATQSDADLATAIENLQAEVAERQRVEDAFRQAQKMEAVGQLTGGVAHDFNNLLTIIRSAVDLLRGRELPDEKRRRYLDAISDTADRAAALTRQLLAFARRQPLQPERFDAAKRVDHTASMVRTMLGSRIRLSVDVRCENCMIEADPNQFETALLNLTVNARDAMEGEGELAITVAWVPGLPERRGHAPTPGSFIAVSVVDTGEGIAPDQLGRIFEPFYTTKDVGQGTGLGLSQVIGFAKQSGGDIVVESEVGRGATFTLYLPQAETEAASAEPVPTQALVEPLVGRGCVLVVEDNQAVGEFAAQLLEELGYSTTWADNAKAALELIGKTPDGFDYVFSDVVMPGMSGVELAQRLRRDHPQLPVVLTSGYSHVLAEEGTHGFPLLHKPYSVEALSHMLRKVANGHS